MDSLDVCDFDLITIGDSVAVNEGSTIMCHFFQDGALHFGEARTAPLPAVCQLSLLRATCRVTAEALIRHQEDILDSYCML